jgi:hypothetical protein
MLKFLIILALWITPGILLFLYLLWVSKGHERQRAQLELPLAQLPVSSTTEKAPNGERTQTKEGSILAANCSAGTGVPREL